MKKFPKVNAFTSGALLLATGSGKLYSCLAGSLVYNGTDPVIGLPISTVASCVSVVEIILGLCLLKWPLSLRAHVFQVSLFAAFGWYRFLISRVLGLNFRCYCAGGIFHASPVIDAIAHQLLTLIFWPLLLFSSVLLTFRLVRNENRKRAVCYLLKNTSNRMHNFCRAQVTNVLLILAILVPKPSMAGDLIGRRVMGVLYDVDYGTDMTANLTNAFQISGVVAGDNFLLECKLLDTENPESLVIGSVRGQLNCLRIGCENGILRTVTEEISVHQNQVRTSITAQVEPYIVPRVFNKPCKVAILALIQNLPLKLKSARYPIFMSKYPPYPIFDVEVVAWEEQKQLQVEALLRRKRKSAQPLWQLFVAKKGGDCITELEVKFREKIPGFPINDVVGTLSIEETVLPTNFFFRPTIAPGTRVLDYTLIDQIQILRKTDISREIWGAVTYKVTNALWEYDLNDAQQATLAVSRAVLARTNPRTRRLVRLAFVAGVSVLFLVPFVVLKLNQGKEPKSESIKTNTQMLENS